MVQSVAVCHKNNIIHRDIKMENFLVSTTDNDPNVDGQNHEINIKLTDFGIACTYDENDPPTKRCGTLPGVAPEILLDIPYCPKVDCWSLGVILYELLTGEQPFYSEDDVETILNILK